MQHIAIKSSRRAVVVVRLQYGTVNQRHYLLWDIVGLFFSHYLSMIILGSLPVGKPQFIVG